MRIPASSMVLRLMAVAGILLALRAPLYAGGAVIEAGSLQREDSVYTLEGSVVIKQEGMVLKADKAVYDEGTGEALAEGNVNFEDAEVSITADRAEVNLDGKTGVLYDAYMLVKAEGVRLWSPRIKKEGEDRYFLKSARVTTCQGPSPAWCVSGQDVDVFLGEWVKAWHATLSARRLPVFYTPFIVAPLVSERRSGLLTPEVGYSSSRGLRYGQPYFWAISDNRDATLTLDIYGRRGFGQGLEYRYVERIGASGKAEVYHARDEELNRDYYTFNGRHRQEGIGFVSINLVNHSEFYREYETYLKDSSRRFLLSQAEVVYARLPGHSKAYVSSRYFQDLYPGVEQDTVAQALPEAGVFIAPIGLGQISLSGLASATNFERDDGEEGQRYNAGLMAWHSIGRGVTVSQSASARDVYYILDTGGAAGMADEEESLNNLAYEYSAVLKGMLQRQYDGALHSVEPSIAYSYATRDGEEPTLFDSIDEFQEGSLVTLGLTNRLSNQSGVFLTVKVLQDYDLEAEERPFRPLTVEAAISRPLSLSASVSYDTYEGRFEYFSSKAYLALGRTSLSAGQTYTKSTGVSTYTAALRQGLSSRLALEAAASYDDEEEGEDGLEELSLDLSYQSQCWGMAVSFVDHPDDYSVSIRLSLLGLGTYGGEIYAAGQSEL